MSRGTLRVYLGAAPGVGKTYRMLDEGWRRRDRGTDVVIGYIETHGRSRTEAQIRDLEAVPRVVREYRGALFEEMDLAAVLARRPTVALVDELAHSNAPGGVHDKRWQDVETLLEAGIDVITTVNIQHLESVNDVVAKITGVAQNETVPDAVVRGAEQIELVDVTPEALRRRMAHGNIYSADKIDASLSNFFRVGNLSALRELALLWLADRVDDALQRYLAVHQIGAAWETRERLIVGVSGSRDDETLMRRAARMASRSGAQIIAVHVDGADEGVSRGVDIDETRHLCDEFGGRFVAIVNDNVAGALVEFARRERGTQLVVGSGKSRSLWRPRGGVVERVLAVANDLDVHVIASPSESVSRGRRVRLAGPSWGRRGAVAAIALGVVLVALALVVKTRLSGLAAVGATVFFAGCAGLVVTTLSRRRAQGERAGAEARLFRSVLVAFGAGEGGVTPVLETVRAFFHATSVTLQSARGGEDLLATSPAPEEETFAVEEGVELSIRGARLSRVDRQLAVDVAGRIGDLRRAVGDPSRTSSPLEDRSVEVRCARALRAVANDLDGPVNHLERTVGALVDGASTAPAAVQRQRLSQVGLKVHQLHKWQANLLDLSRLAAGELKPRWETVAVGELVRTVANGVRPSPTVLELDVPDDLPAVESDPQLLSRVLDTVVTNALRFTTPPRSVRVTVGTTPASVEILVIDGGPGMDIRRRWDVLSGFFIPSEEVDGVDVGLRVAVGLTRLLGGEWRFEDTPAGGLTIVVDLPRTGREMTARTPPIQ